ncbi:type IV secretion system DNA-binding domain-containing protein [uncultured Sphingorhabdus sp.]|uniref:type IV secretion system DNA-binding domain-containing protein n=1 Tax=uncultured Sphingorhabdus sp. TaxID=1686106 RepID=UPI002637A768|nr:type IV secretion system DNA-binding domain-containing protein [uncultured Sphingorhabdus sp.]HMS20505.1 type IV secretion system DNA-binding domain-containing protein [Sphingorhabdus sp.]
MQQPNTYSDGRRKGKLKHHSARGTLPRNSGNYTRGSQLIVHEFMMWWGSSKIPILMILGIFAILYSVALAITLREHEVQMILMRSYAWMWEIMKLNPDKVTNLTLRDGSVVTAHMDMIASHPQIAAAWATATKCFWGSGLVALLVGGPFAVWYVDASSKRGENILEERHQRGAMLVDAEELAPIIDAHNRAEYRKEVRQLFPKHSAEEIARLPFAKRKESGIHHPYNIAGINFPWRTEQGHVMLIGTTGTGKSTVMKDMIVQMRKRQDNGVVFDLTGDFVASFYNPETDVILNPMDERCPNWSVFNDCRDHVDLTSASAALIPIDGGASEPFWTMAARTLFVETCIKLLEDEKQSGGKRKATNQALASRLMMADLKQVHNMLEGTIADPLTAPEAARMAESIRAVFNTNAQALRFLPETGPHFSIKEWVGKTDKRGSILFISSSHNELTLNKALLTLWMNIAVQHLMRLPRTRDLRTWFFFDEVHALHRLPAIEDGLQTARGYGGAFCLGIHSIAKLKETYGEQGAVHLTSLARTKLILGTADRETAEYCSDFIGHREVRKNDEAYSYGYSQMRDAATITPREQIEPLVLPDDLMKLPSLRGFLVYTEGFDAARVKLKYRSYPQVAAPYQTRQNVQPLTLLREAATRPTGEDEEEAGGREGNATPEPEIKETPINVAKEEAEAMFKEEDREGDAAAGTNEPAPKIVQAMFPQTPQTQMKASEAEQRRAEERADTKEGAERSEARRSESDQTRRELGMPFEDHASEERQRGSNSLNRGDSEISLDDDGMGM